MEIFNYLFDIIMEIWTLKTFAILTLEAAIALLITYIQQNRAQQAKSEVYRDCIFNGGTIVHSDDSEIYYDGCTFNETVIVHSGSNNSSDTDEDEKSKSINC